MRKMLSMLALVLVISIAVGITAMAASNSTFAVDVNGVILENTDMYNPYEVFGDVSKLNITSTSTDVDNKYNTYYQVLEGLVKGPVMDMAKAKNIVTQAVIPLRTYGNITVVVQTSDVLGADITYREVIYIKVRKYEIGVNWELITRGKDNIISFTVNTDKIDYIILPNGNIVSKTTSVEYKAEKSADYLFQIKPTFSSKIVDVVCKVVIESPATVTPPADSSNDPGTGTEPPEDLVVSVGDDSTSSSTIPWSDEYGSGSGSSSFVDYHSFSSSIFSSSIDTSSNGGIGGDGSTPPKPGGSGSIGGPLSDKYNPYVTDNNATALFSRSTSMSDSFSTMIKSTDSESDTKKLFLSDEYYIEDDNGKVHMLGAGTPFAKHLVSNYDFEDISTLTYKDLKAVGLLSATGSQFSIALILALAILIVIFHLRPFTKFSVMLLVSLALQIVAYLILNPILPVSFINGNSIIFVVVSGISIILSLLFARFPNKKAIE